MKRLIVAWLVLGSCGVAWAEVPPLPAKPAPVACERSTSAPPPPPSASGWHGPPPCQTPSGERLHHLISAAEHLEAAGMPQEARRVREQAEGEKRALLARIDALETELDRLRQLVRGSQVLVHVTIVEVQRTRLRKLGLDFHTLGDGAVEPGVFAMDGSEPCQLGVVDTGDSIFDLLQALRNDGLSRVLAEPTLVTLSGRPAYVNVGGEVPAAIRRPDGTVAVEQREFGTRIDLVPIVLANGRIRLEVRARVSEIDPSRTVEVEGQKCPCLKAYEVDTGAEIGAGQTLILGGLIQGGRVESTAEPTQKTDALPADAIAHKAQQRDETELWIVVRPEILSAPPPPTLGTHPVPPLPSALPPATAAKPLRPAEEKTK